MLKGINLALQWQGKVLYRDSLCIGHPDQEGMSVYQSSKQDAHQKVVWYIQGACEWLPADCGCNLKHGQLTDKCAAAVV